MGCTRSSDHGGPMSLVGRAQWVGGFIRVMGRQCDLIHAAVLNFNGGSLHRLAHSCRCSSRL